MNRGAHVLDRYGRRGIMVASMLLRSLAFILLALVVSFRSDFLTICVVAHLSISSAGCSSRQQRHGR
jgi:MFS family permease